jgi:uncharacterized protein YndB with AHSA1/START domain
MATDSIRLSRVFAATPERLYRAWLDSREHRAMTGGVATVVAEVGGEHSAWDGYIWGKILALEPPRRIVQSWRTAEFPGSSPNSRLEILFRRATGGTRVTPVHTQIPPGQGKKYEEGWKDAYFRPMTTYFAKLAGAAKPKRTPARKQPARAAKTKRASARGRPARRKAAR